MTNPTEYKFTAKRLDNGEMITVSLGDICRMASGKWHVQEVGAKRLEIDPSTITPLFTTDKPEEWLFENAERLTLSELSEFDALNVMKGLVNGGLETFGMQWSCNEGAPISLINVYRVKAAGYSIDDLFAQISGCLGTDILDDVKPMIDRFAKANGWQQ